MVEERVTDGRRIAQLLAAEVRGHERGPLGSVAVADVADVDAGADGECAYRLRVDDGTDAAVASVLVHPDRASLRFTAPVEVVERAAADAGLAVEDHEGEARPRVPVESGAAVKRGVDALRAVLVERGDDAG